MEKNMDQVLKEYYFSDALTILYHYYTCILNV